MTTKIRPGEFIGTMAELERRQRRARATIAWVRGFRGHKTMMLYVDSGGAIYTTSPESGRFTVLVGQALPKEEPQ